MYLDPFHYLLTTEKQLPVSSVINRAFKYIHVVLSVFQTCSFEVCFNTERLPCVRTPIRFGLMYFYRLQGRWAAASWFWSASAALLNLCLNFSVKPQTCEWDLNFTAHWKIRPGLFSIYFLNKWDNFRLTLTSLEHYASKWCKLCVLLGFGFFSFF